MDSYFLIPYANAAVDATAFGKIVDPIIKNLVYPVIELMFAVALVLFVYGIIQMIIHGTDPTSRKKGQDMILYGSIGMFIMVSAWGIIYLVSNTVIGVVK
ncbi:MAG: hypothetical protein WC666_02845 [Candidatus Paceibacterota bacterium]|jgi:large-conductance mechanosensitive channel